MATKEVTKLSELIDDVQITNPIMGHVLIYNGSVWLNAALTPYYSTSQIDALIAGLAAATHSHAQSNVIGLVDALAGKAAYNHTHTIANISGLALALDAKSDDGHTHAISNVTGLQTALAGKSDVGHNHNDLYYTQVEIDTLNAAIANMGNMKDVDNADVALTIGQWYQTRTSGTKGDGTPIEETLPPTTDADKGKWFEFICGHADGLRILPGVDGEENGQEIIIDGESTGTTGGYIQAYGIGNVAKVMCIAAKKFVVKTGSGAWILTVGV